MTTIPHTSNRPETSDLAVAIATDAKFQPYASFLAWQLASAHPNRDFDIVIASPEPLQPAAVLDAHGVRHLSLDPGEAFSALPLDHRRSVATYLWLALPRASGYRRILALDADIFHERGDLGALLRVDMRGRAISAVRDNKQWRTPGRRTREFRRLGWSARPYFNAGVILVDTQAFAEQSIFERCMDFARDHLAGLGRDQALINGVLHGDWTELSPVWNWQYTWASSYYSATCDPNLIHFIGRRKPWRDAEGALPMRFSAAYDAFLSEHFPGAERVEGLSRRRPPAAHAARRALFRHWRAAGPMERYLGRFPDDLATRDPD